MSSSGTSSCLQLKGMLLISLLLGKEAVRMQELVKLSKQASGEGVNSTESAVDQTDTQDENPEKIWKAMNDACEWKWKPLSCVPAGCTYRPLPLDMTPSESCRPSDEWMLREPGKSYNVMLQAELLDVKTTSFANACQNDWLGFAEQTRCTRRAMHMLRAAEFLGKARQQGAEISDQESDIINKALNRISSLFGEGDSKLLQDLSRKASGDADALSSMPVLLKGLLTGTAKEKEEMREAIRQIPEPVGSVTDEVLEKEMSKALEDINNNIEPKMKYTDISEGSSALIQSSVSFAPYLPIIILVFLVIGYLGMSKKGSTKKEIAADFAADFPEGGTIAAPRNKGTISGPRNKGTIAQKGTIAGPRNKRKITGPRN